MNSREAAIRTCLSNNIDGYGMKQLETAGCITGIVEWIEDYIDRGILKPDIRNYIIKIQETESKAALNNLDISKKIREIIKNSKTGNLDEMRIELFDWIEKETGVRYDKS